MLVGPNSDPLWRQTAVVVSEELLDTDQRLLFLFIGTGTVLKVMSGARGKLLQS
jgi:hypothetical protein